MANHVDWSKVDFSKKSHWKTMLEYLATEMLVDEACEYIVVSWRKKFLEIISAGETSDSFIPLLSALAIFCANTEFVMAETPEETALLERLSSTGICQNLIWSCYRKTSEEPLPINEIRSFIPIAEDTSIRVRHMYEQNPYPRWSYLPDVNRDESEFETLVAGTGTGIEPLVEAKRYYRARILGIDLSRESLAYTLAKAREYEATNLELLHMDILDVGRLGRTFDRIVSSGVLHHMREPKKGLTALVGVLRPGGVIKVALYAAAARQGVLAAMDLHQKLGVEPTAEGIREFRQIILSLPPNHPARPVTLSSDFYSISGTRDLIFHVEQHNFTIREVWEMVEEQGLEMVNFGSREKPMLRFNSLGFTDTLDMGAWEKTEAAYPGTFSDMYTFTARKPL